MSMKSPTMIPPISLNRSWRASSSAAPRFTSSEMCIRDSCKDYDDDIKGLQEQVDNIKSTNPVSTEDISTKSTLIKRAKELDFFAVMRFFMLDSMVYENVRKQIEDVKPDRKSTRLNSSHSRASRMPSSA